MIKTLFALTVVAVLAGCASGAKTENMTVFAEASVVQARTPLKNNVSVKDVTGGQETNPAWKSNIGSSEFEQALEGSLKSAGLLAPGKQAGTHFLTVHLQKVDQPFIGISMTVTATVEYVLTERSTGKNILTKTIALPYTAQFSDAFAGFERLRLANEGAAKANIKAIIDELVTLKVDGITIKQ